MDYDEILEVANELIQDAGRLIKFTRFNRILQNENKPWQGSPDPQNSVDEEIELYGVFVDPSSLRKLGISTDDSDLVKRSQKIAIVAPGTPPKDLREFQQVTDEETLWRITDIETLKPGPTIVLYFVGLAK